MAALRTAVSSQPSLATCCLAGRLSIRSAPCAARAARDLRGPSALPPQRLAPTGRAAASRSANDADCNFRRSSPTDVRGPSKMTAGAVVICAAARPRVPPLWRATWRCRDCGEVVRVKTTSMIAIVICLSALVRPPPTAVFSRRALATGSVAALSVFRTQGEQVEKHTLTHLLPIDACCPLTPAALTAARV